MCEQYHQIGLADSVPHAVLELAKDLCLTSVLGTEIAILPLHTLVSADDHNIHLFAPFGVARVVTTNFRVKEKPAFLRAYNLSLPIKH
jgi:hypothetical protein